MLSLLVLAREEEVFVFDILLLGMDGFQYGLYAVLHRSDLVKVGGLKCYDLSLNNVYRWFMMYDS